MDDAAFFVTGDGQAHGPRIPDGEMHDVAHVDVALNVLVALGSRLDTSARYTREKMKTSATAKYNTAARLEAREGFTGAVGLGVLRR